MTSSETSTESSKNVSVFCPLCCGIFHDWKVLEKGYGCEKFQKSIKLE